MSLLLPKNRKPKFRVGLSIQDLSNVPLVSGLIHVRWHLRDSIRSEARGKTERSAIKDHKVEWYYENDWIVRMVIDKDKKLQEANLEFEVYQEMYGGKERHSLGKLSLNLAEYADCSESLARRYLLQQSKVNSTLKVGLRLEQLTGDTDFEMPELKRAQVFGAITGLLSEGKDIKKRDEDSGNGANDDAVIEEVAHDMEQDIYRHSLTRRWQAQAGELDPADVVDDIFRGGDGWVRPYEYDGVQPRSTRRVVEDEFSSDTLRKTDRRSIDRSSSFDTDAVEAERKQYPWKDVQLAYEADEMLRNLAWSIDASQVEKHIGKNMQERKAPED